MLKPYSFMFAPYVFVLCACVFLGACKDDGIEHYGGGFGVESEQAMMISSDMVMNEVMDSAPAPRMAKSMGRVASTSLQSAPSEMAMDRSQLKGRKIAENHNMTVRVAPDHLKARFDRDMQGCIERGCEIINANIDTFGHGYINARIAPQNLGAYLNFIGSGKGELRAHTVSASDQTFQYIDTDAKIKNLEALRQRLLTLLDDQRTKQVKDIISIEQQLNRVQQQLDSAKGRLRHLKTITNNASVNTQYEVTHRRIDVNYHDISSSFKRAWQNFIRAIGEVVEFIGGALPWLPVIFLGFWIFVKMARFVFGKMSLRPIYVIGKAKKNDVGASKKRKPSKSTKSKTAKKK